MDYYNIGDKLLIHDIDGKRVFLDTDELHMTAHMLEHRVWEPHVREIIRETLKQGDLYVDVGTNIGLHTLYAAGIVGPTGKVVCYEPNKRLFEILQNNIDINGFMERATLYNNAVGNKKEQKSLYIYRGHAGGSGLSKNEEYYQDCIEQTTEVVTLNDTLKGMNIKLLKIDVEGFEKNVLLGGDEVISNSPDITIILEWQPEDMKKCLGEDTPVKILDFFRQNNFYVYKTAYGSSIEKMDINQYSNLLNLRADLVFSRDTHLDKLLVCENTITDENNFLSDDILENDAIDKEKDLLQQIEVLQKKVVQELDEKEQLCRRIIRPTFTEVLKCIGHFILQK